MTSRPSIHSTKRIFSVTHRHWLHYKLRDPGKDFIKHREALVIMDRPVDYQQPAVDSFDEEEILGDAPATATLQTDGSQVRVNQI